MHLIEMYCAFQRVLHLRSKNEQANLAKRIKTEVPLHIFKTYFLTWMLENSLVHSFERDQELLKTVKRNFERERERERELINSFPF